eukprot:767237-Hanusia_phi.AAC.3
MQQHVLELVIVQPQQAQRHQDRHAILEQYPLPAGRLVRNLQQPRGQHGLDDLNALHVTDVCPGNHRNVMTRHP